MIIETSSYLIFKLYYFSKVQNRIFGQSFDPRKRIKKEKQNKKKEKKKDIELEKQNKI